MMLLWTCHARRRQRMQLGNILSYANGIQRGTS